MRQPQEPSTSTPCKPLILSRSKGRKGEITEGKFKDEINRVNAIKREEACKLLRETGDCLPNCDLSVWLRDYSSEPKKPLDPVVMSGNLPSWLRGTLIRNGPGKQSFGDTRFKHLFDCSAVLHRFSLKEGECSYQSKLLRSTTYKRNQAAQRIVVTEFGTSAVPDPCKTIFNRLSSIFTGPEMSDNCMISVYPIGDEMFAFTETPVIQRINPETLDTLGPVNVSEYVNIVHHTSHPHITLDGTVYNLGLSITPLGPKYSIISFPPSDNGYKRMMENGRIECQVPVRWPLYPSYMHTFGLTPNYFIIVEQPLSVSVSGVVASNFVNRPTSSNLVWFDDKQTHIYVIKRNENSYKIFRSEPFFFLHIINQYEENSNIIIDICAYKDPSMISCMYLDALKEAKLNPDYASMFRGRPIRLVLPMSNENKESTVVPEFLCDLGCETPRINYELCLGVKYRYFYAISSDVDLDNPGTLIKVDTVSKEKLTWSENGTFPSEPVFVPNPTAQSEDDGVVLSALLSIKDVNEISLLVLDAKDFSEISRAVFSTPGPVPKCLHGWFQPNK